MKGSPSLRRIYITGRNSAFLPLFCIGAFGLVVAIVAYWADCPEYKKPLSLVWQVCLAVSSSLFAGFLADVVVSLNRAQSVFTLAPRLVSPVIDVVIGNLSVSVPDQAKHAAGVMETKLRKIREKGVSGKERFELCKLEQMLKVEPERRYVTTGPGESTAIGLLSSAHYSLYPDLATTGRAVRLSVGDPGSSLATRPPQSSGLLVSLGGPKYNYITRDILALTPVRNVVEFLVEDDEYRRQFSVTGRKTLSPNIYRREGNVDYGLVIRYKDLLVIAGAATWGVIVAAHYVFLEPLARAAVQKLRHASIDPLVTDYVMVIQCCIPNEKDNFTIGESEIVYVRELD